MQALLEVENLETQFATREGTLHAVNGISFHLNEGETLGIVGESGSGKSVAVLSILHLIPSPPGKVISGRALYGGKDLLKLPVSQVRSILGSEISMIFQDPMTSFNPVLPIGRQVGEPLELHTSLRGREIHRKVLETLGLVGIHDANERLKSFPHQFSGGMRQRAMIAMALICHPKIIIADEPTTALDVTIQAQILDLVKALRDEIGMSMIWITHDLGIIAGLADRVLVMYGGQVIEEVPVTELYRNPQHPYTLGLLSSLPRMDDAGYRRLAQIDGLPPVLMEKPASCPFAPRCSYAVQRCRLENPSLQEAGDCHRVACWIDTHTRKERE